MKIYTRVVMDMDTFETLEEDSFEYEGPLALAYDDGDNDGDTSSGDTDAAESDSSMGGDRGGNEGGANGNDTGTRSPLPGFMQDFSALDMDRFSRKQTASEIAEDQKTLNPVSTFSTMKDIASAVLSMASGNLPGAIKDAYDAISGYKSSRKDQKEAIASALEATNHTPAEIAEATKTAAQAASLAGDRETASGLNELSSDVSAAFNGNEASGNQIFSASELYGEAGNMATTSGENSQGTTNASLNDQFYNLFQGENAPYGIEQLLQGYTDGNQGFIDSTNARTGQNENGLEDYLKGLGNLDADWLEFEKSYLDQGDNLQKKYDWSNSLYSGINNDLQKDRLAVGDISANLEEQYQALPALNLKVPEKMGGTLIPMAPGKWSAMYGQQAGTLADLVKQQSATSGEQADVVAKRGNTINNMAGLLNQMANVQSTALGNRTANNQNGLANLLDTNRQNQSNAESALAAGQQQQTVPLGMAQDIFSMDKGFQSSNALQQARIDYEKSQEPGTLETWAPIAVDLAKTATDTDWGAVGDAASGIWDTISDWF